MKIVHFKKRTVSMVFYLPPSFSLPSYYCEASTFSIEIANGMGSEDFHFPNTSA